MGANRHHSSWLFLFRCWVSVMLLMDGAIPVAAYLSSSFFGEVSSSDCNSDLSVVKMLSSVLLHYFYVQRTVGNIGWHCLKVNEHSSTASSVEVFYRTPTPSVSK